MAEFYTGSKQAAVATAILVIVLICAPAATRRVAAQGSLPAPWTQRDIGSPGVAGTASESGGTFTVEASGTDIWSTSDQFHFVYYPVSGDVDVRARVTAIERVHWWTKGGVMIRETLDANSRHAMTVVSASSGLAFQRRLTTGGNSASTERSGAAPQWVRLVRAGTLFTSYVSSDGSTWTQVGTATIAMADAVYVGLALVSVDNSQLATASFSNVTVQASPWTNRDVGSPAVAGRSSQSGGTFSVTGAGTDIADPSDQFQYMYQRVDGDVQIVARVASLGNTNANAKAGVMIREALTGTSAYTYMFGTPGAGWAWRSRAAANGASVTMPGSPGPVPGWVRLVRQGAAFTGYESTDGVNWTVVGSENISMSTSVYVGLAVTSRSASATTTGTFTNVSIGRPAQPGNLAPSASITSPAAGSHFTAPASVTINASAADSDGTVARVDFFANGTSIGSDTTAPFSFSWTNVAAGTYALTARATDNAGASTTSTAVSITVDPAGNAAPTVSLTSPANNAVFTAPASIAMAASASDSNGSVTRVDFYQGSTLLGSDTSAPYSFTWSNVPAGTYSLTARATDNAGAVGTSAAVSVTVNPVAAQTTSVAFTPASDHASNVVSYRVELRRAGDPVSATPVASRDIGKPGIVNNEITADISAIVNPLASGSYYAVVVAVNPAGTGTSTPSATFTK